MILYTIDLKYNELKSNISKNILKASILGPYGCFCVLTDCYINYIKV